MIHWLVQSMENNVEFAHLVASHGLLSDVEGVRYGQLSTKKRRADWLIGRYTAKKLMQMLIWEQHGREVLLNQIVVGNHDSGEPYAACTIEELESPITISISHSNGHAFCAAVTESQVALGADLETIAPRSDLFVADYFTADEQALVAKTADDLRDVVVNGIWSAKEAALKALHKGLSVDTRCVNCRLILEGDPFSSWIPFSVEIDKQRYKETAPELQGWWRVQDSFVLTMVTEKQCRLTDQQPEIISIERSSA